MSSFYSIRTSFQLDRINLILSPVAYFVEPDSTASVAPFTGCDGIALLWWMFAALHCRYLLRIPKSSNLPLIIMVRARVKYFMVLAVLSFCV